ncbi:MAG: helix-hairpin-helix domain-containing protein [Candidatus Omnitrophica bacterium]|nr:helix-hairpin-helix domain-containing protein [Candidatus Omnitrophota bacterium]
MIHLTQQERRVIVFVSMAVFAGLCLDLSLKGYGVKLPFLRILDDPSFYPRVNVNSASLEDLLALPRMSLETARLILDYRREKGRFISMEELRSLLRFSESRWNYVAQKLKVE